MKLSQEENLRYSRHFNLQEVGPEGQVTLKKSSVLLIGAGGLGSPLALYLTAAGVGRIGIIEFDTVDESNLQRQILYGTSQVGQKKLDCAKERLQDLNPHVEFQFYPERLDAKNALEIFSSYDLVIDGADNFPTRYLVNDSCVLSGKPLVSGAIMGFEGQLSVFNHRGGPCYRCLFPSPPPAGTVPSCAEGGVLGVLPGVIGTLQATEALKILLNKGETVSGRLIVYDALQMRFTDLKVAKNLNCPLCSENPSITQLIDYEDFCGLINEEVKEISPRELMEQREQITLIDVREDYEREICVIKDSLHWPLKSIPSIETHLDRSSPIVAYCKVGGRSKEAVKQLVKMGFTNVKSLEGGILQWREEIDPKIKKY